MFLPIETDNLTRDYRDVRAVEHLSLRVAEGEIYAFLGLNGAGKTTTIRMLLFELTREQGGTVFMSSHILAEVSRLAGRIGIIHQGRLLQELTPPSWSVTLALIAANLVVVLGWGDYFAWAVPLLYTQADSVLPAISHWIVILTGFLEVVGTYLWWHSTDQNR